MFTILVSENDPDFLRLCKVFFERNQYEVRIVGIDDVIETAREVHPDLIIVNVHTGKNGAGIELTGDIRNDYQLREIPIIQLVDSDTWFEPAMGVQSGANLVVQKPIEMFKLYDLVKTLVRDKFMHRVQTEVMDMMLVLKRLQMVGDDKVKLIQFKDFMKLKAEFFDRVDPKIEAM
jgi:DNA-binding response OmpR family regulator